jgi:hypothetical protein
MLTATDIASNADCDLTLQRKRHASAAPIA